MSTARKLIEQGHNPDDIRPKDYLKQMPDPRVVKMEVMLRFDEPIDEMNVPDLIRDVVEALNHYANNVGFSIETASVEDCVVSPIQPQRGKPYRANFASWYAKTTGSGDPRA